MSYNDISKKSEHLQRQLRDYASIAIAFSGGVDSTFLLASARKELGENIIAIIAKTPVFPMDEENEAIAFLKQENIDYSIIQPDLMSVDTFLENPIDRCYICKKILFDEIIKEAHKKGINTIAHGVNTDDFDDYRPGLRASEELGVISPLADAGFSKEEIREASRQMGLHTAEKPAMACIASRIPYGERISLKKLSQIEEAEGVLKKLGFGMIRVRHHGNVARIEVHPDEITKLIGEECRLTVSREFEKLGFLYTSLDLKGYAQGSMNKAIITG